MQTQTFITAPDYLDRSVASFVDDPADSDFQRGYLAALLDMAESIGVDLGSEPFCLVRKQPGAPAKRIKRAKASA